MLCKLLVIRYWKERPVRHSRVGEGNTTVIYCKHRVENEDICRDVSNVRDQGRFCSCLIIKSFLLWLKEDRQSLRSLRHVVKPVSSCQTGKIMKQEVTLELMSCIHRLKKMAVLHHVTLSKTDNTPSDSDHIFAGFWRKMQISVVTRLKHSYTSLTSSHSKPVCLSFYMEQERRCLEKNTIKVYQKHVLPPLMSNNDF